VLAEPLVASSRLAVFRFDPLAILTVDVVVVNAPMLRWIFQRVGVIRRVSHRTQLLFPGAGAHSTGALN
jgi:hypothetical protein